MRFSAGLSRRVGLGRVGISRRGTAWIGARGGKSGAYISALAGSSPRRLRAVPQAPAEVGPAQFQVYPHGRVTFTLGGQTVEVTRDELRNILKQADATVKGATVKGSR